MKVSKIILKKFMMEFILVKLQTCRYSVQAATHINRRYHRLFLEYIPKNSCLNKNIYAEKVYGVPCTCAQPTILLKMELTWELSQEASKNMMYLREPPWRKLHFSKNGGLKSIPAILWKTKSTTKWFMYLLCEVGLLEKFRKIFLWD